MSEVYGPVPSRRLGQSLGVDPIPLKTCNYNCVYCQLGRTRPLSNARRDFFPPENILAQVQTALAAREPGDIDYVTFVGQGEPLLCASLGRLIRGVKAMSEIPVAVITNGSLIYRSEVREELVAADVVMPTLDAAEEDLFRRVNRPWPKLHIGDIIEGMVSFREMFEGQLWVEVMLVKGLNDSEDSLLSLRDALALIRPDRTQINVPVRPPAETWVEIPDDEAVIRATSILGEASEVVAPYEGQFDLSGCADVREAIEAIIRRHPMREGRLVETLARHLSASRPRVSLEQVERTLTEMEANGQTTRRAYRGETFWEYAGTRDSSLHSE